MLIVTGSDDNYVPGVMVLIASAAFHNPGARFVVLDMGIRPDNRDRIDALARRIDADIRRIEIPDDTFQDIPVTREHLTRSTYLRLLIPSLFPEEPRAIYMDCDMVVLDSLADLDNLPLNEAIVAAVPCPSPDMKDVVATGHRLGTYVNAGLLVMNLPIWRAEKVVEQCLQLLSNPDNPLLNEDQSAINIIARDRILLLPERYNVYSDPTAYKRVEDLPARPVVVHYVVGNKPWKRSTTMGQLWTTHADRIADILPPRRKVTLGQRLSQINRGRKIFLGLLLHRSKYRIRHSVAQRMDAGIVSEYLARIR